MDEDRKVTEGVWHVEAKEDDRDSLITVWVGEDSPGQASYPARLTVPEASELLTALAKAIGETWTNEKAHRHFKEGKYLSQEFTP